MKKIMIMLSMASMLFAVSDFVEETNKLLPLTNSYDGVDLISLSLDGKTIQVNMQLTKDIDYELSEDLIGTCLNPTIRKHIDQGYSYKYLIHSENPYEFTVSKEDCE